MLEPESLWLYHNGIIPSDFGKIGDCCRTSHAKYVDTYDAQVEKMAV